MKKIIKVLKIIGISFLALLVTFLFVFVKFNIPKSQLEETYFTEYSHYIDVTIQNLDGEDITTTLHYQDLGNEEDPVVVLIHGAFSSSHTFLPWAETLLEEGYRVIMPDLPYFGLSEGFDDNITSYRRSAESIHFIIESLNITSIDIAGNSVGGAVSWFYTSEYQDSVRSLTLIDAMYPYTDQGGRETLTKLAQSDWFANSVSTLTPKFLLKAILSTAYGDKEKLTDDVLTRYYDILRKEGTRAHILSVMQEEEPAFKYSDRLASITVPTFIIWGELDTWIDPSVADLFIDMMSVPDERVYFIENTGHLPMEEAPGETIIDYLEILSSPI